MNQKPVDPSTIRDERPALERALDLLRFRLTPIRLADRRRFSSELDAARFAAARPVRVER